MKKYKKNIIVLFLIIIVIVLASYFLFISGTTNKIKANLNKLESNISKGNISYYPVITMVINSSGEKVVNEDVSVIVIAKSTYKIDKLYYSYDMKNWYDDVYEADFGNNANIKLVFDKTMNETLYIKVENEKGYQSYVYKTKINIDKQNPKIEINNNKIIVSDNEYLSNIQYSNDKINWIDNIVSSNLKEINKDEIEYLYMRVVDTAGNISKTKRIK